MLQGCSCYVDMGKAGGGGRLPRRDNVLTCGDKIRVRQNRARLNSLYVSLVTSVLDGETDGL
jgi:hypothetical protein